MNLSRAVASRFWWVRTAIDQLSKVNRLQLPVLYYSLPQRVLKTASKGSRVHGKCILLFCFLPSADHYKLLIPLRHLNLIIIICFVLFHSGRDQEWISYMKELGICTSHHLVCSGLQDIEMWVNILILTYCCSFFNLMCRERGITS
jgi:hypothetical protein